MIPKMINAMVDDTMADEKPKTLSVKLHTDVVESARIVATLRGVSMTDLISDMIREPLAKSEQEEIDRRSSAVKTAKKGAK